MLFYSARASAGVTLAALLLLSACVDPPAEWAATAATPGSALGFDPPPEPASPPTGTYPCYFYRDARTVASSALLQIRVLPGARIELAGETVPFTFSGEVLTLAAGRFAGLTAELHHRGDGQPVLVFLRAEAEAGGHQVDLGDTWCYYDPTQ
jgi:hypothetical protein